MALTRSTDPLVWIDCEMTGLDPTTDTILSISCILTTSTLSPLPNSGRGYHATILTPSSALQSMSPWCITTHTATGLTSICQDPAVSISAPLAAKQLLQYIKQHIPQPRTALLAGNSVHVDKLFLMREPWSEIIEYLHYRILDVSAIKEGVRRWCGEDVLARAPVKKGLHTAEDDVRESLEEARFYMRLFEGLTAKVKDGIDGGDDEGRAERG